MSEALIDTQHLDKVMRGCLYAEEEVTDGIPPDALRIEAVVCTFIFHPERLATHRTDVARMLMDLPVPLRKSSGGGWSFLEACMDRNGVQWTGLHALMEALLALGIGLGLVEVLLPRSMWSMLPGGVPYFAVLDDECEKALS